MRVRLALPMAEWPDAWRNGWEQALAPADSLFAPNAGSADLRAGSLRIRHEAVRTFLGFLARSGRLVDAMPASLVVTPDNIEAYVEEQRARGVRNSTLRLRLGALHGALRMIFPGQDLTFVRRPGGHPLRLTFPHKRRHVEVRDHRELLARAAELHAQGLAGKGYAGGRIALRDAAIIGLLSCQGIRSRALAEMQVEQHLFAMNGCYWVDLAAENTKMGRHYAAPLPVELTPILEDYLTKARPGLGGAEHADAMARGAGTTAAAGKHGIPSAPADACLVRHRPGTALVPQMHHHHCRPDRSGAGRRCRSGAGPQPAGRAGALQHGKRSRRGATPYPADGTPDGRDRRPCRGGVSQEQADRRAQTDDTASQSPVLNRRRAEPRLEHAVRLHGSPAFRRAATIRLQLLDPPAIVADSPRLQTKKAAGSGKRRLMQRCQARSWG